MLKKTMLLAGAALAVIAFAAPGSASAGWTHEGLPLGQDDYIEFSGPAAYEVTGSAGADATIHIEIEMTAGTTAGHVTGFEDTNCKGTLAFAGMSCTGTAANLPWAAEITGADQITIKGVDVLTHYYSSLDPGHTKVLNQTTLKGSIVATVDDGTAITTATLKGQSLTMNGNPAVIAGDLFASPSGTYGTH